MNSARILVIDDHSINRKLFESVLKSAGYDVSSEGDAMSGISRARLEVPDLIIMDINLPELDGLSATRQIKADPVLRSVPVIAITAHATKEFENRSREAGCDGFITKPISPPAFLEAIRPHLSRVSARRD